MNYNFDEIINRNGTDSVKWDAVERRWGRNDLIPMWVADMDFRTAPFVIDALKKRLDHEVLGYTFYGVRTVTVYYFIKIIVHTA